MVDPNDYRPIKMLIVDDEPHITTVLARFFGKEEVVTVNDGVSAIARLRAGEHFDIILCDLNMPDTDGIDIFEEMTQNRPELCARTIFLSGGAYDPRMVAFTERTEQPVVDKPFQFSALIEMVEQMVGAMRLASQG